MRDLIKHRTFGVAFVGMMLLGVWLVNAIFTQKFTSFDEVALKTDTAGLNLPARADVKVRGEIIGQVTKAESSADGAVLTLGIQPDKIGAIPENVTASPLTTDLRLARIVLVARTRISTSRLFGRIFAAPA